MTPARFTTVLDEIGCAAEVADVPNDRETAQDQADAAATAALRLLDYRRRIHTVLYGRCDCVPDLAGLCFDCGQRAAPPVMDRPGCIIPLPGQKAVAFAVTLVRQCRRTVRILKSAASPTRPLAAEGETVHPPAVSPPSPRLVERPPAPSQRQPRPAEPVPVVGRGTNLDEAQR